MAVTTRVSVASGGEERTGTSDQAQISANGRFVVFASTAPLVPEDTLRPAQLTDPCGDIYVHDRDTGTTTRVSVSSSGAQANGRSYEPSISGDGRYVRLHVVGDQSGGRTTPTVCPTVFCTID